MTATVVVDLGWGDSGKGTTVDWLCRERHVATVVRFNGSCQAGHNVVLPDGTSHRFSQFGSGTFSGVPTFLSRYMVVDPLRIASEALHLEQVGLVHALDLMSIDAEAMVLTPYHAAAQQLRERARGEHRHGSCGYGFGEAVNFAQLFGTPLRMRHLGTRAAFTYLGHVRDYYREQFPQIESLVPSFGDILEAYDACAARMLIVDGQQHLKRMANRGDLVFEGAQGVLLDEDYGFHPYTTWSRTTFANADELLAEIGMGGYHLGVVRSYSTRHGPGPFVAEAEFKFDEPHNPWNEWQGEFRVGHFDAVAINYAIRACAAAGGQVDGLAITHLDRTADIGLYCGAYVDTKNEFENHTHLTIIDPTLLAARKHRTEWLDQCVPRYTNFTNDNQAVAIAVILGVPDVQMVSWGPTCQDKEADVFVDLLRRQRPKMRRSLTS